ncbi:hypothetical protein CEXT_390891 [Caerostris extrusa]|uniref:Uncharacterized protein n=1 Tax=Caerostris extrusa TaxID=172846 RepID=A0AAV4M8N8_CAEEX|nr:hypothetical protein CEXT_390891 [Caerostris extrusa]
MTLLAPGSKPSIAAWPMGQHGFQNWEIGLLHLRNCCSIPTIFSSTWSAFRVISLLWPLHILIGKSSHSQSVELMRKESHKTRLFALPTTTFIHSFPLFSLLTFTEIPSFPLFTFVFPFS